MICYDAQNTVIVKCNHQAEKKYIINNNKVRKMTFKNISRVKQEEIALMYISWYKDKNLAQCLSTDKFIASV